MQFLARMREPVDISLGGLRIFSDEDRKVGELLKLEFFLPDVPPVTYTAEVVWVDPLEEGAPARFDVGLKFIQLEPEAIKVLLQVVGPPEET
jgi:PilZ domain-containing protein